MSTKRILGWIFIPFVMLILEWKNIGKPLKVYGIMCYVLFWAVFIVLVVNSDVENTSNNEENTKPTKKIEQETKPYVLYPSSIIESIKSLTEPGMSNVDKYTMFEQKLIGLEPTKKDVEEHLKIIKKAYNQLSYESIKTKNKELLLKEIYSARIIDRFYAFNEVSNPTGLFAFNYLQIAKDAYRDILVKENYEINKKTMDNHFSNMK
jgi:hypothetical protein